MLIQGKARYAKVLGAPVWGFENAHKEWTIDVEVDEKTEERLRKEGLNVKTKNDVTYITFRRKELKGDGSPNQPIRVVSPDGKTEWPQNVKIGNGSAVKVNFAINEYKKGKFAANILSMQVWEHVPYEGGEFTANENAPKSDAEDWSE